MATINKMQQSWVKGPDENLKAKWKTSEKQPDPVLKEPEDQVSISSPQERQDEIDQAKLQEAMQKLQQAQKEHPEQFAKLGLKTMKNSFLDFSADGILQKTPQIAITAAQIALCIATGSLVPPLLPALGLGAVGLVSNLVLKDLNTRVQQKAQAKALAEIAGIEPKYAQKIVEMQAKAMAQQKQLGKFTTKAMKDEGMDQWVTGVLKDAENEDALAKLEAGKNVKYKGLGQKFGRLLGQYKPEEAQARAIFLELMLRGVIVEDKEVMAFLDTQPKKRQEAVKEKAAELKEALVQEQKSEQAAAAKQAESPQAVMNEQQQVAFLKSFTDDFIHDPKMQDFTKNVAFKDQPDALGTLYNNKTDDMSEQLKMQFAMAAFTKGLMEQNPEVQGFTQGLAAQYPPEAMGFLDQVVTQNAMAAQQQNSAQNVEGTQEVSQAGGLSDQEKMATLKSFSEDFLGDKKMEEFTKNVAFKGQPQIADALYNPEVPIENKMDPVMAAFTLGVMDENPDVIAFNDKVTPKYQGAKEEFLSEIITEKAELIGQQRAAAGQ